MRATDNPANSSVTGPLVESARMGSRRWIAIHSGSGDKESAVLGSRPRITLLSKPNGKNRPQDGNTL